MTDPKDGTSLENIKLTIQQMKDQNTYRVGNGLSELRVSLALMAKSQSNANYSAHFVGHSKHAGFENAAWNFTAKADFTHQWVDEEKALFDKAVEEAGWEPVAPKDAWAFFDQHNDYFLSKGLDFSTVGHYLNTVTPAWKFMGFAISTYGEAGSNGIKFPVTAVVNYNSVYGFAGGSYEGYTVGKFEKLFNTYLESLSQPGSTGAEADPKYAEALKNAKAEFESASAGVDSAKTLADTKDAATKAAQGKLDAIEAQLAANGLDALTTARDAAQAEVDAADAKLANATSAKATAEKQAANAASAQTAADAAVTDAQTAADAAKADAVAKAADHKTLAEAFQRDYGQLAEFTAKVADARVADAAAADELEAAKDALTSAQAADTAAKAALANAGDAYLTANTELETAEDASEKAQGDLADAQRSLDALTDVQAKLEAARDVSEEAGVALEAAKADLAAAQGKRDTAARELDVARKAIALAQADLDEVKSLDLTRAIATGDVSGLPADLAVLAGAAHNAAIRATGAKTALEAAVAAHAPHAQAVKDAEAAYADAVAALDAARATLAAWDAEHAPKPADPEPEPEVDGGAEGRNGKAPALPERKTSASKAKGQKSVKANKGGLPQTGDAVGLVAYVTAAGVVLAGSGIIRRRARS